MSLFCVYNHLKVRALGNGAFGLSTSHKCAETDNSGDHVLISLPVFCRPRIFLINSIVLFSFRNLLLFAAIVKS